MVGSVWQDSRAAAGEEWGESALKKLIHNSMKQEGDYKRNKTEAQVKRGQDGYLHCFSYFYTFTWKCVEIFLYPEIYIQNTFAFVVGNKTRKKTNQKKKAPKNPHPKHPNN